MLEDADHARARGAAILLISVLHFVPGDLGGLMTGLRRLMAPGSLLVLTHATPAASTDQRDGIAAVYANTPTPLHLRTPTEIRALLAGLDLVHPGPNADGVAELVPVTDWRPDAGSAPLAATVTDSPLLTGFLAGAGWSPHPIRRSQPGGPGRNRHRRFGLPGRPAPVPAVASFGAPRP